MSVGSSEIVFQTYSLFITDSRGKSITFLVLTKVFSDQIVKHDQANFEGREKTSYRQKYHYDRFLRSAPFYGKHVHNFDSTKEHHWND
jgi:hypothetical protein